MSAVPNATEGTLISTARDGSIGLNKDAADVKALVAEWSAQTDAACEATHHQLVVNGTKILAEGGADGTPLMGLDGKPKVSRRNTLVLWLMLPCAPAASQSHHTRWTPARKDSRVLWRASKWGLTGASPVQQW
jgi:hypothetical protein